MTSTPKKYTHRQRRLLLLISVTLLTLHALAAPLPLSEAHPFQLANDALMGDYEGARVEGATTTPLFAQVIALGKGHYQVNLIDAWDQRLPVRAVLQGPQQDGCVALKGEEAGVAWTARLDEAGIAGHYAGKAEGEFTLKKTVRLSPTLGAKPPEDAVVLFDGSSLDAWEHPDANPWLVNLAELIGGHHRVAYLRTYLHAPASQQVRIGLGSDDGVKAWLNGDLVHANNAARPVVQNEDQFPASLKEGWNTLLLKITQGEGGWGACLSVRSPEGAPVLGLRAATQPEAAKAVRLDATEGHVLQWQLSGPYVQEATRGVALFDVAFPPEQSGACEWTTPLLGEAARNCRWKLLENGAMEVRDGGIISKQAFMDQRVHVEFRTPFMPEAREQARGNSGVYLQGRYEVQILDSYGLEGAWNECGGLYKIAAPKVNMAAPPLQWQSYDIEFYAPLFDAAGKQIKEAAITVRHNGVLIHEQQAFPAPTTASIGGDIRKPGGLYLQDHGNPVWFRNVWVQPIEADAQ